MSNTDDQREEELNAEAVKQINRLVARGRCIAFIGSGLSGELYPSFRQQMVDLANHCGVAYDSDADPFELAEECKNCMTTSVRLCRSPL